MMKKKFKWVWSYLLVMSVISLTILIINSMDDSQLPKVINDINSGVIGAILTTIITLLLLNNQNDVQENQLKNSVIYEEKLKLFNDFLNTLNAAMEDGELSPSEMKKIIFQYSLIRMHITAKSAQEIEGFIQQIDQAFFYVDENYIPRFDVLIKLFNGICNVLRRELYRGQSTVQLGDFDFPNFKAIAYKKRTIKQAVHSIDDALRLYQMNDQIYFEDKQGTKIQFTLSQGNIDNLEKGYRLVQRVLSELNVPGIEERFLLNQQEMNGNRYLGLFNVYYYFNDVQLATFGLSQKNRVYLKIKLEKESVFSFEPEDNVLDYEMGIKKDLGVFLQQLSSKKG